MKIIFFGDDQYSAIVLEKLLKSKYSKQILAVVTHQPKPEGRKKLITPSPIDLLANQHNKLIVYYSSTNKYPITLMKLLEKHPETLGIIASFGHIIPTKLIQEFSFGLINIHPSLLPQYRNVSPLQYAILLSDKTTGVSIFTISSFIDRGKILAKSIERIKPNDTTPTLGQRLFSKGAKLTIQLLNNNLKPLPLPSGSNPEDTIIFTKKFTKQSGFIEWKVLQKLIRAYRITQKDTNNPYLRLQLKRNGKTSLGHLLRAFTPWPGIWTIAPTTKDKKRIKITSWLPNIKVQLEGKAKPISWTDFTKHYLP